MPNHVTNIIRAPREVLNSLLHEEDGELVIDFNLLVPVPADDDPRITATKRDYGNGMVGWTDGVSPMDFARSLWGTKWNAYSQEVTLNDEDGELRFNTAWSHPVPIIEALTAKHPEARIEVQFADEDLGSNLGEYVVQGGEIVEQTEFAGHYDDEKSLAFALKIKYNQTLEEYRADLED